MIEGISNDKFVCWMCQKENYEKINYEIIDYVTMYYKFKKREKSIGLRSRKSTYVTKVKFDTENDFSNDLPLPSKRELNSSSLQSKKLIVPCKCGKYCHEECLKIYCILSLSYTCENCGEDFDLEVYSLPLDKVFIIKMIIKYFLIFFILIAMFTIGIILFVRKKCFRNELIFWNYYLGFIFILLSVILITLSILKLIKEKEKRNKCLKISQNGKKSTRREIAEYFSQIYQKNYLDLISQKTENNIFTETVTLPESEIFAYITENNFNAKNIIHRSNTFCPSSIGSDEEFNLELFESQFKKSKRRRDIIKSTAFELCEHYSFQKLKSTNNIIDNLKFQTQKSVTNFLFSASPEKPILKSRTNNVNRHHQIKSNIDHIKFDMSERNSFIPTEENNNLVFPDINLEKNPFMNNNNNNNKNEDSDNTPGFCK